MGGKIQLGLKQMGGGGNPIWFETNGGKNPIGFETNGGGWDPVGFETNGEKNHIGFEGNGGKILLGLELMGEKSYWV